MVESDHGSNAVFDASVDDIIVMRNTELVDRPTTEWKYSRPGDGEGIMLDPDSGETCNVLLVQIVMIISDITSGIVEDEVWNSMWRDVPDGRTFAFSFGSTFNLEGSTCYTKEEVFRK